MTIVTTHPCHIGKGMVLRAGAHLSAVTSVYNTLGHDWALSPTDTTHLAIVPNTALKHRTRKGYFMSYWE